MLHAVWYEDRAVQLLKFSMSQEIKKWPFAALNIENSKNIILTYFQKLMWFSLFATKLRENFVPKWNALDLSLRDRLYTCIEFAFYLHYVV